MKRTLLLITLIVTLLIGSKRIHAQNEQPKLNQVELMKQWLGTWKGNIGKDTVEIWEGKPYGNAVIINVSHVINDKTSDYYIINCGYDKRDDKLKGFNLLPNANFSTWIGMFTSDKTFKADMVDSFNPEKIWWKNDVEFKTPSEMVVRGFNAQGAKIGEYTFIKVK
jgi:hypothetical protein